MQNSCDFLSVLFYETGKTVPDFGDDNNAKWFWLKAFVNWIALFVRELSQESRRPSSGYWRTLWGLAGTMALLGGAGRAGALEWGQGQGGMLFQELNLMLFSLIWLLVPLVCFDSVSRERREGTLNLLFLTPLRPLDILLEKGFLHALRIFVCLLATLPIMMIPLFLGGVSLLDGARMFFLHASAGMLAWFATMVASVRCRSAASSLGLSLFLSVVLFCGLGGGYVVISIGMFLEQSGIGWEREGVLQVSKYFFQVSWERLPFNQRGVTLGIAPMRSGGMGGGVGWSKVFQAGAMFIGALVTLVVGLRFLARYLRLSVWGDGDKKGLAASIGMKRRIFFSKGDRWLQVSVLLRRYGLVRTAVVVFLFVCVISSYWWGKFSDDSSILLDKVILLFFLTSCLQAFTMGWLVAEERQSGMAEMMLSIPRHFSCYCRSLVGLAYAPVLLSWAILFGFLIVNSEYWLAGQLILTLVNVGGLSSVFAWRSMSVPSGMGLSVILAWLLPWMLGWLIGGSDRYLFGMVFSAGMSLWMGILIWRLCKCEGRIL